MIICSCNAINERGIAEAAAQGATSPHKAFEMLGGKVCCGCCCREVAAMLQAANPVNAS